MAKYRKTALVEAEQFLPPAQIPEGCYQEGMLGDVANGHGEWFLKTLEGKHPLRYADYICKGVQGERWNVEVSIFQSTYELVPATPAASGEIPAGMVDKVQEAWKAIVTEFGRYMSNRRGGYYPEKLDMDAAVAAITTPPASAETAIPQDWKLVPVEATDDMIAAGLGTPDKWGRLPVSIHPATAYAAMLSAAPSAPATEAGDGHDRKFAFRGGQIVNRVSGEPIPADEPVMIFRARDPHALQVIRYYHSLVMDAHHEQAVQDRINEFQTFKNDHLDRMKEPGVTRHIRLNALATPTDQVKDDGRGGGA